MRIHTVVSKGLGCIFFAAGVSALPAEIVYENDFSARTSKGAVFIR